MAPAVREQPAVSARVTLHVPVEPRRRVPVDQIGAAQRRAEGVVRDEREVQVRATANDDLARVDAVLGVLVGDERLAIEPLVLTRLLTGLVVVVLDRLALLGRARR